MTSVAGDFYDFIQIDNTHLGMLMADVSGHGLPSALIASMLQVALTAQVGHSSEPAKVLRGLNRALCGKFTHNFVTAAYVYVDLEKTLMRLCRCRTPARSSVSQRHWEGRPSSREWFDSRNV